MPSVHVCYFCVALLVHDVKVKIDRPGVHLFSLSYAPRKTPSQNKICAAGARRSLCLRAVHAAHGEELEFPAAGSESSDQKKKSSLVLSSMSLVLSLCLFENGLEVLKFFNLIKCPIGRVRREANLRRHTVVCIVHEDVVSPVV